MIENNGIKSNVTYTYSNIEIPHMKKSDQILLATKILKNNLIEKSSYMIYENQEEIAVAIGEYLFIEVYKDRLITICGENKEEYLVKNISKDLHEMLKSLKLEDWRLYGISDFNYAKNTFLHNVSQKDILMQLFIPNIDIRITNSLIKVKSINNHKNIFSKVKNCISEMKDYVSKKEVENTNIDIIKSVDEEYYKKIVAKGINEIENNDYDKVILSRKIILNRKISVIDSFINGRQFNTPARSYCMKIKDLEVVGFSPETVVEVDNNRNVYTFPLAGTRALTNDLSINKKLKENLLKDPKEIAEHAISVKLAYEELETICDKESVSVIKFMEVLERGTVQHLASRLKGKLKDELNEWDAFTTLFPAVTASGIPKVECIDAIDRLEKDERGLYSGGVITCDKNGTLDVALVLRTAFQNNVETWVRVGAGIVKLSNPERELEETKEKVGSIVNQLVYVKS